MMSGKGPESLREQLAQREVPPCPERFMASTTELDPQKRREHEVVVVPGSIHLIGRGTRAVIYAARARVIGSLPRRPDDPQKGTPFEDRKRAYEFPLVVKVYYAESAANVAFSLYDICRDAGLNVPPTFRGALKQNALVMTDLRIPREVRSLEEIELWETKQEPSNEIYVISSNMQNWSIGSESLQKKGLEGVANWDWVLKTLFIEPLERSADGNIIRGSQVRRATVNHIELQSDVYFFRVPAHVLVPEIDPLAVDFDIIKHPQESRGDDGLLRYNAGALFLTCKLFIENFVEEDKQKPYLDSLYAAYSQLLSTEPQE